MVDRRERSLNISMKTIPKSWIHSLLQSILLCRIIGSVSYRPRRKVILVTNPLPVDSNEYGPLMSDVIDMKVVTMISDEHAQVVWYTNSLFCSCS